MNEAIILEAKSQNIEALKKLYNLYKPKVYKTAYMILNDSSTAEDILQEVFIQIYSKINKLDNVEAFERWIYRITVNCCMKYFKKNKRFGSLITESNFKEEEDLTDLPEEQLINKEFVQEVWNIICSLPEPQRVPIVLFYYNEISIKEIASIMKCSEGTVKSRLHYGKKYIKENLEKIIR
jgi:RNA polymerase sigma factor, sigma-70 family